VVVFDEKDVRAFEELSPHLRGYQAEERVVVPGAYALLLERRSEPPRRGG
jgi:hypothetical protein